MTYHSSSSSSSYSSKVFYSFLHRNEEPYVATGYVVYRQQVSGSTSGDYEHVATLAPTGLGNPITITGFDVITKCGYSYNYKCAAVNAQRRIFGN